MTSLHGSALGEGALWDPCTGRLLWIDIVRGKLFSYDEASADNRDLHLKQLLGTVVPGKLESDNFIPLNPETIYQCLIELRNV